LAGYEEGGRLRFDDGGSARNLKREGFIRSLWSRRAGKKLEEKGLEDEQFDKARRGPKVGEKPRH